MLNTGIEYKDITGEIERTSNHDFWAKAYTENRMVFIVGCVPKGVDGASGLFKLPEKYAPRDTTPGIISYTSFHGDIGKISSVVIDINGAISFYTASALLENELFSIQYPMKQG